MFDQATRLKLRFESNKGLLSVEQLWDLPLTTLNELAKNLNRQIKEVGDDEDFISEKSSVDSQVQLRFDIAKHIIGVKLKERNDTQTAQDRKAHNQTIMALIEQKQQQELAGKSVEELKALLK